MPKKTTTKKEPDYEVKAKIMGKTFTAKGKTIVEALEKLKTGTVAGTVIMTVKHGDNEKDRILPMTNARRLFMTAGLTREVALKNTANQFEGI